MIKIILSDIRKNRHYFKKILKPGLFFIIVSILLIILSWVRIYYFSTELKYYKPKGEYYVNRDFSGNLYFNDQPNSTIFSDVVIPAIKTAQNSIIMSMFSFHSEEIKKALAERYQNFVRIDLLFDSSNKVRHHYFFGDEPQLKEKITDLGEDNSISAENPDPNFGKMHHKFMLIDPHHSNKKLLVGSLNYTDLQQQYDPSFLLETADPAFIDAFIGESEFLLNGISGQKKISYNNYKPLNTKIHYQNGFMEIWFSPGFKENSVKTRMIELIESAQTSINIIIWRFNDEEIMRALVKKAESGVSVKIILDDYYLWVEDPTLFWVRDGIISGQINNLELISDLYRTLDFKKILSAHDDYFNPYIHQHTMIIDEKITLSGTNNWTNKGFYKNDETTFISDIPFWTEGFMKSFQLHYNELKNRPLKFSYDNNTLTLNENQNIVGKDIMIFHERSESQLIPNACYQNTINSSTQSFRLPAQCNQFTSLVYILDKQKKVIASDYLKFSTIKKTNAIK